MSEKKIKGITIDLDINNDKLVEKLKAIAKHTEALVSELEEIEKDTSEYCDGE